MTKIVFKYDQNCLQIPHLAEFPDSCIPEFLQARVALFTTFCPFLACLNPTLAEGDLDGDNEEEEEQED